MKPIIISTVLCLLICVYAHAQYNNDIIIESILKTDTTSIGQKIKFPSFVNDEVTLLKITIPPGKTTGWHKHTIPVFAYILKGTLTVEFENKTVKQFTENSTFAEVIDIYHTGTNNGKENLVLIAFYLGEKAKPLSIQKQAITK